MERSRFATRQLRSALLPLDSNMDDDGGDFAALGPRAQHAIDAAFTAATRDPASGSTKPSPRKRRRLNEPAPPSPVAGGFIPDTAPAPAAGGFIVEDPPVEPSVITIGEPAPGGFLVAESPITGTDARIPLELIPRALQALDLPPDDPDVLTIFQNAAAGWGANAGAGGDAVSLKDWRAVCAVLLVARTEDDFPPLPEPREDEDMEDDDDEDEYEEDEDDDEDEDEPPPDDSDDEDFGAPSRKGKGKKGKVRGTIDTNTDDSPPTLTPRQKRAARATFALFFPDVPDEQLDAQRIRIRDISRVAALLKEKITAEEVRLNGPMAMLAADYCRLWRCCRSSARRWIRAWALETLSRSSYSRNSYETDSHPVLLYHLPPACNGRATRGKHRNSSTLSALRSRRPLYSSALFSNDMLLQLATTGLSFTS